MMHNCFRGNWPCYDLQLCVFPPTFERRVNPGGHIIGAMAALSAKQLSQKLGAIAESWTKDPFRPNLQLQTFLKSLASHPKLTTQAVEATRALRDNDMQKRVCFFLRVYYL